MHRFSALAAIVLLAACGSDESGQSNAQFAPGGAVGGGSGAPGAVVARDTAADGGPVYGTFRITSPENEISVETVNEDGTIAITYADDRVETGRWVQRPPNLFCVTMDYEGAEEACFAESVNKDGVWISYDPVEQTTSYIQRIGE